MASTQALSPSLFHCNKSRYNRDESAGEIKLHVRNIRRGWARDQEREARRRPVLRSAEALAHRKIARISPAVDDEQALWPPPLIPCSSLCILALNVCS